MNDPVLDHADTGKPKGKMMFTNRFVLEWLTAIVGAWVVLSNWIVPAVIPGIVLNNAVQLNHILVGVAIVVVALAGAFAFRIWEELALALLGLWLIASPWLLGFSGAGALVASDVAVGLIVVATSAWVVFTDEASA